MVAKKTYTKICKDCGVEFEGARNSRFCPDCKALRRKKTFKKANRKRALSSTHELLRDERRENYYDVLKTRINYDANKDYYPQNDDAYNENIGLWVNDVYSQKHSDEDWMKYHIKLKELKRMLHI